MACRLVLVRHGRTAWNAERRFLGVSDLPLDEVGLAEAAALGAARRGTFDAIWSSPLARARATADALRPPDVAIDPDLRELSQGDLEGLAGPEAFERHPEFFLAFQADPTDVRTPGPRGETLRELQARALLAVGRIADQGRERIAVVTHQMVIASVSCAVAGAPLAEWRRFGVPNTGTVELVREAAGWTFA